MLLVLWLLILYVINANKNKQHKLVTLFSLTVTGSFPFLHHSTYLSLQTFQSDLITYSSQANSCATFRSLVVAQLSDAASVSIMSTKDRTIPRMWGMPLFSTSLYAVIRASLQSCGINANTHCGCISGGGNNQHRLLTAMT